MTDEIEVLSGRDFEQAMEFLDRVFGEYRPHDFRHLLPSAYQPTDESMSHNLVIRRQDRLRALVGLFPVDWTVGDTVLRIGRIGGVAVDAEYRGQGLMRRLMNAACQRMREQGCHLGLLDGDRTLYAPFGFERGGVEFVWHLSTRDLRRALPRAAFGLCPYESGMGEELTLLAQFEPLGCRRSPRAFGAHLVAWQHEPRVAQDPSGRLIGYLTGSRTQRRLMEIVAPDPWTALAMADAWSKGADFSVVSSSLPSPRMELLTRLSDRVQAQESGNWWILDWPRVLGALLAARHRAEPLPSGCVVIGVQGEAEALELSIDDSEAKCRTTDAEPQVVASANLWTRVLTGPVPASSLMRLGPARLLAEWTPLPLWVSRQDHV